MSNKAVHESHIWQSDDVAEKYHQTEIVTRVFADLLIQKTGIANHEGDIRVLDLACGTGAVAASLYAALPREKWDRVKVVGGDNSEAMIAYLRKKGEREGWRGLEAVILDGAAPTWDPIPQSSFTHIFSNFGISTLPLTALQNAHNALKPDGYLAVAHWTKVPWYQYLVRAAESVSKSNSTPLALPTHDQFMGFMYQENSWDTVDGNKKLLTDAGFRDVHVDVESRKIPAATPASFADALSVPLGLFSGGWGGGDAEVKKRLVKEVQDTLQGLLEADFGKEGPVAMVWEAFVVTGRK